MAKPENSKSQLPLLLLSVLTLVHSLSLYQVIMFLLRERKENWTNSSNERLLLLNRLMSKDPLTYQILNQDVSPSWHSPDEGQVRNDDDSEMAKTEFWPNGDGEVLVDLTEEYKDLGLIE